MVRLYAERTAETWTAFQGSAVAVAGATVSRALGVWNGTRERSMVIEVTDAQERDARDLARAILATGQNAVLLSTRSGDELIAA